MWMIKKMSELWKPVTGYEDIYEISDQGHIRSIDHMTLKVGNSFHVYNYLGTELHPSKTKYGSLRITLSRGKLKKTFNVAKLVAQHFLDDYCEDLDLEFINGNRSDCRVSNLRCRYGD